MYLVTQSLQTNANYVSSGEIPITYSCANVNVGDRTSFLRSNYQCNFTISGILYKKKYMLIR